MLFRIPTNLLPTLSNIPENASGSPVQLFQLFLVSIQLVVIASTNTFGMENEAKRDETHKFYKLINVIHWM